VAASHLCFERRALRACLRYHWPHNVRELEQALTTATALATSDTIALEDLPPALSNGTEQPPLVAALPPLDAADRELREHLVELLSVHNGNIVAVAEALGKRRAQIYKWVKRLAIDLTAFRRTNVTSTRWLHSCRFRPSKAPDCKAPSHPGYSNSLPATQ
jgi:transcriptional regulator of acetoin/glycerol metabolism